VGTAPHCRAGDRISVEGRYAQFPAGEWLDIAQVNDLGGRTGPRKSSRALRLMGIDPAAIPQASDPGQQFIPGDSDDNPPGPATYPRCARSAWPVACDVATASLSSPCRPP